MKADYKELLKQANVVGVVADANDLDCAFQLSPCPHPNHEFVRILEA